MPLPDTDKMQNFSYKYADMTDKEFHHFLLDGLQKLYFIKKIKFDEL